MKVYDKACAWCAKPFTTSIHDQRFCGRSCSAKWRMRQPEIIAKVHAPEVAAKRGERKRAWYAAGSSDAEKQRARIAALNPTSRLDVREKLSRKLRDIGHKPCVHGGNGRGPTEAQQAMASVLDSSWVVEYALSLGPRQAGYPTHYKLDLANLAMRVAIEVDGRSHYSEVKKAQDEKKAEKLASLGWDVLHFWNWDILAWIEAGMPADDPISQALAAYGVQAQR